jgi:hypothetical protein
MRVDWEDLIRDVQSMIRDARYGEDKIEAKKACNPEMRMECLHLLFLLAFVKTTSYVLFIYTYRHSKYT